MERICRTRNDGLRRNVLAKHRVRDVSARPRGTRGHGRHNPESLLHAGVEVGKSEERVMIQIEVVAKRVHELRPQAIEHRTIPEDVPEERRRALADCVPSGDDEERGVRRGFCFRQLVFAGFGALLVGASGGA